ncbi:MAG TPA: ATP-binding protein, partial [Geobacterales bacterium]|nr:ATP-binding protein [Geobacterales bacterium]
MIEEQNPWWISKDLVEENETYRRYKESPIKWIPDILDKISLTPFSLNFIFGPRQVGKTTALILLIKRLLDRGVNPKSVFYFTCEKIANHRELDQILEQYIKMKNRERIGSSYIILDEVTFPKDWYRSIKFRIDNGDFKNDVLILSGSLSIKAKGEIESFPGRRGNGKTLIMYPLPFSQYVRLFLNLPEMARSIEDSVSLAKKNIQFRSKIEEIFETYLITGGFPNSIKDYVIEGKIRSTTISDFISSVILDINKLRRSETFFKLAVKSIIERTSSEISFHNLAKEVGNIKTLISYVEFLQNLYFLKVLLAIDPNSGIPLPRKERKFYFIDPFLYKA